MYTIREFRKNTKKAFDDAAEGHEVVIARGKQLFQIVALVNLPLGGNSFESTPTGIKPIKPLAPVTDAFEQDAEPEPFGAIIEAPGHVVDALGEAFAKANLCEHGAGRRFCKIKKCPNWQFRYN